MPSLRVIRKRIGSIRNTGQITKAMKMVSAAKLRRGQARISSARPYADKMREVLASLAARTDSAGHPLLAVREPRRVEVVVITSNRGLCGAYNNNIVRMAEGFIKGLPPGREVGITAVGRKGRDHFRRQSQRISNDYLEIAAAPEYGHAAAIAREIISAYREEAVDQVYLVYSRFLSAMVQRPQVQRLLPVEPMERTPGEVLVDYIFEPGASEIFNTLIPKYVEVQIFKALLEAAASEHAARMVAMGNASKNAEDMVSRLTLEMNRARQEAITKELLDIVNGSEAQKREDR